MRTDLFDFELPRSGSRFIPQNPGLGADARGRSAAGALRDRGVSRLPDLLEPGDALVFNDTA